jgi:hypothetical protein
MRGYAHHISIGQWQFAGALRAISEQYSAIGPHNIGDLGHRLNNAGFVIHRLHRIARGACDRIPVNISVWTDGQAGCTCHSQDRIMFNRAGNRIMATQRKGNCLARAAGKNDFTIPIQRSSDAASWRSPAPRGLRGPRYAVRMD